MRGLRPSLTRRDAKVVLTAVVVLSVLVESALCGDESEIRPPVVLPEAGTDGLDEVLAGEILLSELGCVNCHAADSAEERPPGRRGPDLTAVLTRLRSEYVRAFLRAPHVTEAGTVMPDVLPRDGRAAVIDAILQRFEQPRVLQELPREDGSVENGRLLYHTIGCVMCHAPETNVRPQDLPARAELATPAGLSVPLGDLASKYTGAGLVGFLRDPLSVRPSARMPSLHLEAVETRDLAAYLRRGAGPSIPETRTTSQSASEPTVLAKCAACHTGIESANALEAPPLDQLDPNARHGCLSDAPTGARYPFADAQRTALRAALQERRTRGFPAAGIRLRAAFLGMRCHACHSRGADSPEPARALWLASASEQDLGLEGRVPPPLDGVGSKLTVETLHAMVRGADPVRPYLRTRMPDFGPALADWLTPQVVTADRRPDEKRIERRGRNLWGRHLVGTNALSCIVCHDLAGRSSLGIPALDLASVPRRLRVEWFHDYMIAPARFRSGTRMPSFWPEGQAALQKYLGGNTPLQIDSIWVYLMELDQTRLPFGLESQEEFELVPKERPIVFRTFMEGVGVHAIAVGFPAGVHYAFNALTPGPALLWQGRFLDAESTWDDRFTPLAVPLGIAVERLPAGAPLARLPSSEELWPDAPWPEGDAPGVSRLGRMLGYRLDPSGVPTFLYRIADVEVNERIEPLTESEPARGLRRTVEVGVGNGILWLRAAASPRLERTGESAWTTDSGLRVALPSSHEQARERASGGHQELLVPLVLDPSKPRRIVVVWTW